MKKIAILLIMGMISIAGAGTTDTPPRLVNSTGDFEHPGQGVTNQSLAWTKMQTFFGNEHIFLLSRLDQGYWMFIQIFTFKYGPSQKYGVYSKVIADNGKTWFAKREVEMKDAIVSYNSINWESKGTSIKGNHPEFRFIIKEEAFQADVTAKAFFKGWDMGKFYYEENDKKAYWDVPVYLPWGKLEGTITLDGKTIKVSGYTYGDRVHGVHRFDLVDPIFYGIRGVSPVQGSPQVSIQVAYNGINPAHGNAYNAVLMVMNPNGFLITSQKVKIHGADYRKNNETGYTFPRSFIVDADDPGKGFKLRGTFKADRPIEIMDVISQLPPYLRALALKFFKLPVFSKWDGIFEGVYTFKDEQVNFRIRSMGEASFVGGPATIMK